jgi:hypothetical protein
MGFPIPSQAEPITPDGKSLVTKAWYAFLYHLKLRLTDGKVLFSDNGEVAEATVGAGLTLNRVTNTLSASGTPFPEAPLDGRQYGRQMADWTVVNAASQVAPGLPNYSIQYNQDQVFTGNAEYVIDPTSHILYLGASSPWVIKPVANVASGKTITLQGGQGTVGGNLLLNGGVPTTGVGGAVVVTGSVGAGAGAGGAVEITGGAGGPTNGNGGALTWAAGAATGAGTGGTVNLHGGAAMGGGGGGSVTIGGGDSSATGGLVLIKGGSPGGTVSIQGGTGAQVTISSEANIILDADLGLYLTGSSSVGTAGQVLTSQGVGAQPIWGNGPAQLGELLVDSAGNILFDTSGDVLYES